MTTEVIEGTLKGADVAGDVTTGAVVGLDVVETIDVDEPAADVGFDSAVRRTSEPHAAATSTPVASKT